MKIAMVSPGDLSKPFGGQNIAVELHNRLPNFGHESWFIAPHPTKETKMNLKNYKYFGKSFSVEMNQSTNTVSLNSNEVNVELDNFLDEKRFDIVCVHEPLQPFLNWEVLKQSRSLNIGWFHSTTFRDLDSFPYNLVMEALGDWLKSKLQGYIAASPTAKKTWRKLFGGKGTIIPAGVDVDLYSKAKKIDLGTGTRILFVGRLEKRKGVLDAIRSMKRVKNLSDATLVIVGDGPQSGRAHRLVKKLDLEDIVRFVGRVSEKDLPAYYRSSDVFIAPSLGGESLGLVLLEAMAAGTPVVAYANDGYKFTLRGNPWGGSLVKVGSCEGLANSISEIINNPSLKSEVLSWQKERVGEFDWDRVVSKFLDYANLVKASCQK